MAPDPLVDALISYWSLGPAAVDEESRRICREVAGVLARSMSGGELLALQEAPREHRQEITAGVAAWLAMTKPNEEAAPHSITIHQNNQGGINLGTVGTIHGGLNLSLPAPATESPGGRQDRAAAPAESPKLRILFLGANPADSTPLRLDEEVRAIDRALVTAALGDRCELSQKWAVRVSELQEHLLRAKPHVLHFSGHGSPDRSILLAGDDGTSRPVAADRLARLLGRFNQRLRCVVLNACYTKEHGEAIAEHIDCVVGMSTTVGDRAALRFSAAFYLAVASGCSVKDAFEQARCDIELGELGENEVPTLLAHRGDPAQLFLVEAGSTLPG
jgi:CHAT domain-containing protein